MINKLVSFLRIVWHKFWAGHQIICDVEAYVTTKYYCADCTFVGWEKKS